MTAADPELLRLRNSIDNIDAALVHLLAERFKCTQAVGRYKAAHGLPPADPAREAQLVEQWHGVYEGLYSGSTFATGAPAAVLGQDFGGWNSSYTGEPIPLEDMLEWRAATIDRIKSLGPQRVLEIGVGSGLVLSQLAPQCERYVGTDMSAVAIDTLARSLEQLRIGWRDRVQLLTQPAQR